MGSPTIPKIHYNTKFTEDQLLNYLNRHRIYDPQKFDSQKDFVEITIAIFAKRHFEKTSKKKLFIAFEMKEKLNITSTELNNPLTIKKILTKRNHNSLIDFMLVPTDQSGIAYAFQVKRFFIKTGDKNIEDAMAKAINSYLKLRVSQEINLIIVPDKYLKSIVWATKINLAKLKKLIKIKKKNNSYAEIFVMSDDNLLKI
ncbi:MAG: hypothetical protein UW21_C0028G0005 [Candidatus Woesebacteria bacterium GW2011_GWB1_44_11b]|uniref:Uncharacterized protein n=1 Tax=Candidatus Woesebacteria bacterium GW2011_GWB1_44_11b TaxID=1618580 RepID=A0A0G1GBM6_9BACT|nr:MAG: hypothetical protein UW21_C0028G0005 [Candidatus Woesebacteria bacterium GW2011_GWB1_44_11b]